MKYDKKYLKKMKANPGDKTLSPTCDNCEFNMGNVCAGSGDRTDGKGDIYGMPIDETKKMFPDGCSDFGISFSAFEIQEKMNGR